mmetsp:Transcript_31680/g.50900  ORF Transcript_31680/g.50900 Transcript_31680/m.50900 type:complete len:272 (+) Transcript_31680:105-920(+)
MRYAVSLNFSFFFFFFFFRDPSARVDISASFSNVWLASIFGLKSVSTTILTSNTTLDPSFRTTTKSALIFEPAIFATSRLKETTPPHPRMSSSKFCLSRDSATCSPSLGCIPIHTPLGFNSLFSGSLTLNSCAINSHFGVPYFPTAVALTGTPFLSLALFTTISAFGIILPPQSRHGTCAIASRDSISMSATYGDLFRVLGLRRNLAPKTGSGTRSTNRTRSSFPTRVIPRVTPCVTPSSLDRTRVMESLLQDEARVLMERVWTRVWIRVR